MYEDFLYDSWMLSAAEESAAERYLPDDYEPETIRFDVVWESESEQCEDMFSVEVENEPDSPKLARAEAEWEIMSREDIPDDAVIMEIREA